MERIKSLLDAILALLVGVAGVLIVLIEGNNIQLTVFRANNFL